MAEYGIRIFKNAKINDLEDDINKMLESDPQINIKDIKFNSCVSSNVELHTALVLYKVM